MSDREMLELAAKAAELSLSRCDDSVWDDERADYVGWNPLTDDGDALRLMVKLRLGTLFPTEIGRDRVNVKGHTESLALNDPLAATRRAIVRAAAEIGRGIARQTARADLPEDNYYKTMAEAEIGRKMP